MRHKAADITCPPPYGYLIYSIKRRPPQLFPAGRERKRRTLSGASSRSRPVNMSFMAAGGPLLTQEAGHHDAEVNS